MPEKDNFIDFLKLLSEYESQCSGVYMLNPSGLAKTKEAASVVNIIIETMGGSYRVNTEPKNLCAEFVLPAMLGLIYRRFLRWCLLWLSSRLTGSSSH